MRWWASLPLLIVTAHLWNIGCAGNPPAPVVRSSDIFLPRDTETIEGRVPRHATLAEVLRQNQVSDPWATATVNRVASVFNLRRFRQGNPYRLVRTLDGRLRELEYTIDADSLLRVVSSVEQPQEATALHASVVSIVKTRQLVAALASINQDHPSLVGALEAAGERVELALALARIFAGDVDFNNDLRSGDSVRLLFERDSHEDGAFGGYGEIVAAQLDTGNRQRHAVLFAPPGGKAAYYDENGRSLNRFFLRSPLRFNPRITSRFSRRRLHPVLRRYRPHLGVDYGAARGAPVVAVASGKVLSAGFKGGAGRMIRIAHARGYESLYLHLSSIAVRKGARVNQGQLIGRVGSSGLATGAHLDYRLKKHGVFVNPVVEHRKLPPGDPVPALYLSGFHAARDSALRQLDAAIAQGAVAKSERPPASHAAPSAGTPAPDH